MNLDPSLFLGNSNDFYKPKSNSSSSLREEEPVDQHSTYKHSSEIFYLVNDENLIQWYYRALSKMNEDSQNAYEYVHIF